MQELSGLLFARSIAGINIHQCLTMKRFGIAVACLLDILIMMTFFSTSLQSNRSKKQDNVHTNTESVQCISIVYSICPYKYNQ